MFLKLFAYFFHIRNCTGEEFGDGLSVSSLVFWQVLLPVWLTSQWRIYHTWSSQQSNHVSWLGNFTIYIVIIVYAILNYQQCACCFRSFTIDIVINVYAVFNYQQCACCYWSFKNSSDFWFTMTGWWVAVVSAYVKL